MKHIRTMPKRATGRWFNAFRCSKSPEMKAVCSHVQTLIENYETSPMAPPKLQRKRARRDSEKRPDKVNFELLVEALICDLTLHHLKQDDKNFLVSRRNDDLAKPSRYRPVHLGKPLTHILDCLASPDLGIIEQLKGCKVAGSHLGHTTMLKPTQRLIDLITDIPYSAIGLHPGEEVIVLKDISGLGDSRQWVEYVDDAFTRRVRSQLRQINDYLEAADIVVAEIEGVNVDSTARRMKRVFTYGSFATGGRLFRGFWQQMSRAQRADQLFLDAEYTVTLDYSQAALRIAYGTAGADLPEGDGYLLPGLEGERSTVKKLINSMMFPRHPNWPHKLPAKLMNKLPNRFDEADVIALIQAKHPALTDYWWTNIGHVIQRVESDIIVDCILKCIDLNIIALQVHDALIVPYSAKDTVSAIMSETFEGHTGIVGEVTVE